MWKIALGFLVFAGIALFILTRSGGDVALGGEKHSVEAPAAPPAASAAAAPSKP